MINSYVEELARDCFLEDLHKAVNDETVETIMEAFDHPEILHKLNSWEELGI